MKTKLVIACILSMIPFFVFSQVSEKIEYNVEYKIVGNKICKIITRTERPSATNYIFMADTVKTLCVTDSARSSIFSINPKKFFNSDSITIENYYDIGYSSILMKSNKYSRWLSIKDNIVTLNYGKPERYYYKELIGTIIIFILIVLLVSIVAKVDDPEFFKPYKLTTFAIIFIAIVLNLIVDIPWLDIAVIYTFTLSSYFILTRTLFAKIIRKRILKKKSFDTRNPSKILDNGDIVLKDYNNWIFVDKDYKILEKQPFAWIDYSIGNLSITRNKGTKYGLIQSDNFRIIHEAIHSNAFTFQNYVVIGDLNSGLFVYNTLTCERVNFKLTPASDTKYLFIVIDENTSIKIDEQGNFFSK